VNIAYSDASVHKLQPNHSSYSDKSWSRASR